MRAGALFGRLAVAASLASSMAQGQSLDYAGFEGMFGEPVTTSATGKPERLSDTPVTMDIITANDIKRSGARDLATLLRALPGILGYRGYSGSSPMSMGAVLLNGREVFLGPFGQTYLFSLPVELEEIRQIEVVRGPQSALYGFNSGEGVINIITSDPATDPVDLVRGRIGNEARRDGAAILTQKLAPGIGVRLTADGDHAHDPNEVTAPGNRVAPENPDRRTLAATISAYLDNGDHATFEVSHSDVAARTLVPQIDQFLDMRLQSDAVKADYTAETAAGRLGMLMSYTSYKVPQASTSTLSGFSLNDHNVDLRVSDLIKIGAADTLRAEFEYRHEAVHASSSAGPTDTGLLVGDAMWEHQIAPNLSLINAIRAGDGKTQQTLQMAPFATTAAHNPDLGDNHALIYKAGPDDSVRLSVARGIDLPSPLDFSQIGLAGNSAGKSMLLNDPNLRQSTDTEERATWDHQLRDAGATGRISLFHTQSQNAIALVPLQVFESVLPNCVRPTRLSAALCNSLTSDPHLSGDMTGIQFQLDHKAAEGPVWGLDYSVVSFQPHATAIAATLVPSLPIAQTIEKLNAKIGYAGMDADGRRWSADLRLQYANPQQELMLLTAPSPHVALVAGKDIVTLSPHLSWSPLDRLTLDLAADSLWRYKENPYERAPSSYFMTVTVAY